MGFQVIFEGEITPLKPVMRPAERRVTKLEKTSNYYKVAEGKESLPEKEQILQHQQPKNRIPQNIYKQKREKRPVLLANQIMTFPVKTLTSEATVFEVRKIFLQSRFRYIPVLSKEKKLIGIISDRDIFSEMENFYTVDSGSSKSTQFHMTQSRKELLNLLSQKKTIKGIFKTQVIAASPETEVRQIARVLIREQIGSMPIIKEEGDLAGIITRSDVLRVLVGQSSLDLWL
ncbi:MAG: CBS domain-containing protein [Candidatus Brocadiaceae bacterium]|nr:CBS domain-containing protein [Candidatus Brocadiaceae bacterium]